MFSRELPAERVRRRDGLELTQSMDIEATSHSDEKNSSALQVDSDRVSGRRPGDRNDEMEMRDSDATLLIRIDDENRLANSRDTAMAVVAHSLSFYPMFYKMTMENKE